MEYVTVSIVTTYTELTLDINRLKSVIPEVSPVSQ